MIVPGLLQYIYGYRYNPNVADSFTYNLEIINKTLSDQTLLVNEHYDFYKILEAKGKLSIVNEVQQGRDLAVLGKMEGEHENYSLSRIITSPMRDNSDIIYLYSFIDKGENNGTENGPNEAAEPAPESTEGIRLVVLTTCKSPESFDRTIVAGYIPAP